MRTLVEQGGWVLIAIFITSALAWTLIAWKFLALRGETRGGVAWAQQVIDHVRRGNRADALRTCEARQNLMARLLQAALTTDEIERRFFENHLRPHFDAEATHLRHNLDLIAIAGGVCPLLGLLGTVLGMIVTFDSLTISHVQTSAESLASGISQAMITTQAGLVLALPIVLMHGYLSSRITRYLEKTTLTVKKLETLLCKD